MRNALPWSSRSRADPALIAAIRAGTLDEPPAGLPPRALQSLAEAIVYGSGNRPPDLRDQFRLLGRLAAIDALSPGLRLNAAIAATHKALELCDAERLAEAGSLLDATAPLLDGLAADGPMRENPLHVGFSLRYVRLNAALFAGVPGRLDALSRAVPADPLPEDSTPPRFFYRTVANLARCQGFAAVAARQAGDTERLAALAAAGGRQLSAALDLRGARAAHFRRKGRHGDDGWFADAEIRRAAAIGELIEQLASGVCPSPDAPVLALGPLCVAQRTLPERAALLGAWQGWAEGRLSR